MKMTIAEFAKAQNVSLTVANGAVTYLEAKGQVTKTGEVKAVVGEDGKPKRGRPSAIYEFPETISFSL